MSSMHPLRLPLGWPAVLTSVALAVTGCPSDQDPSKPSGTTLKPRPSAPAASGAPAAGGASPSPAPSSLASGLPGPITSPSSSTSTTTSPTPGTVGGASPTPAATASVAATASASPSPGATTTPTPTPTPSAVPTFPALSAPTLTTNLGEVLTLAGNGAQGDANGSGADVTFNQPAGIAFAPNGRLYVVESSFTGTRVRQVEQTGNTTTFATGLVGQPEGIAADTAGNLYVADTLAHVIRKVSPTGQVTRFAGAEGTSGSSLGSATAVRFNQPTDVAVDAAGNVYVADAGNFRIVKLAPGAQGPNSSEAGNATLLAGSGVSGPSGDGTGAQATFLSLGRIQVDAAGTVWAGDAFGIRRITPAGVVTSISLQGAGVNQAQPLAHPRVEGLRFVYSAQDHAVYKVATPATAGEPFTVELLAGAAGSASFADGVATAARFNAPSKMALGDDGTIYLVDSNNQRVRRIR